MHWFPDAQQWGEMFWPAVSWGEKVIRPLIVYIVLLVAFRFTSRRELNQATLFDFLVVLLISNIVQNAMIGEDNSIFGSMAGVVTVLGLSLGLDKISGKSNKARKTLEGQPTLLVYKGKVLEESMKRESVEEHDLMTGLRLQGVAALKEVRYAILELDGNISVIRNDAPQPETEDDCVTSEIKEQIPKESTAPSRQ